MTAPTRRNSRRLLLGVAIGVNLLLGLPMALVPGPAARLLGAPEPATGFSARVLGAVLFGIGLALLLELRRSRRQTRGPGLEGAAVINLCAAAAVVRWLVLGESFFRFAGGSSSGVLWSFLSG